MNNLVSTKMKFATVRFVPWTFELRDQNYTTALTYTITDKWTRSKLYTHSQQVVFLEGGGDHPMRGGIVRKICDGE